jgi:predicted lipoprotein with Yx(FWY)xxD motif
MKPLLSAAAALVAVIAVIAIAGCGGGNGGGAAATGSSTTVSSKQVGGVGTVLVDAKGLPLYSPDQEKSGNIVCTGGCMSIWKPLTIRSGRPTGPGHLGVVRRSDGTRQVTADGRPLYTFVQDTAGQVTGNGVHDAFGGRRFTWHVITSKGTAATGSPSSGSGSGGASGGGAYGSY